MYIDSGILCISLPFMCSLLSSRFHIDHSRSACQWACSISIERFWQTLSRLVTKACHRLQLDRRPLKVFSPPRVPTSASKMNIRLARVRGLSRSRSPKPDSRQVDDLPGMQACNLQNLPENYTMKYCMPSCIYAT